jgi:NAD(P)-dependent dehydrogenase (short-subunit alcohol dehydrogenase family)/membrane protease YdiL (CAAX protease family)
MPSSEHADGSGAHGDGDGVPHGTVGSDDGLKRAGVFLAIAFAVSWSAWIAAALLGEPRTALVAALHYAGGLGPLVAGVGMAVFAEDRAYRAEYVRRLVDPRRIRRWWWAFCLAFVPALTLLTMAVDAAAGAPSSLEELGSWVRDPAALLGLVAFALVFGPLTEEPGWRGYALDRLLDWHSPLPATIVIGFAWALWHVPLFFVPGSYQAELGFGTAGFLVFELSIVGVSFLYTAAFVGTARSTLAAVLLHFSVNLSGELLAPGPRAEALGMGLLLVIAAMLSIRWALETIPRPAPWETRVSMAGKTCVVTGATSGLGCATARGLARAGATVVMVGREAGSARAALEELAEETGSETLHAVECDLSSLESVRRCAAELLERFPKLDVLVNAGGVVVWRRKLSVDGYELIFATDCLGPFLLTRMLTPALEAAAPSRIVTVAGEAHRRAEIHFGDPMLERGFSMRTAVGQAKLARIMWTFEMAERLEGTGVTASAVHPGWVRTRRFRHAPWYLRPFTWTINLGMTDADHAAQSILRAALDPALEDKSGRYVVQTGALSRSSDLTYDRAARGRLWKLLERMSEPGDGPEAAPVSTIAEA